MSKHCDGGLLSQDVNPKKNSQTAYFDLSITFTSSGICPFYDVKVPGIKFGKRNFHLLLKSLVQEKHLNYSFHLQLIIKHIFKWAIFLTHASCSYVMNDFMLCNGFQDKDVGLPSLRILQLIIMTGLKDWHWRRKDNVSSRGVCLRF